MNIARTSVTLAWHKRLASPANLYPLVVYADTLPKPENSISPTEATITAVLYRFAAHVLGSERTFIEREAVALKERELFAVKRLLEGRLKEIDELIRQLSR